MLVSIEGIDYVFDLEACLYFSQSGGNLKSVLFQRATEKKIVVTREVFKQVREFDGDLAKEIEASPIAILELDTDVYKAAGALNDIFLATGHPLNAAANEKMPVIALVHCAQNGKVPSCQMVTGDIGPHASSMSSLCGALGIPIIDVANGI